MGGIVRAFTNIVSSIFGGGDEPAAPPPPPPPITPSTPPTAPKDDSAEVLAAQEEARRRQGAMRGRASTVLTAGGWKGLGESEDGGGVAKKSLLG